MHFLPAPSFSTDLLLPRPTEARAAEQSTGNPGAEPPGVLLPLSITGLGRFNVQLLVFSWVMWCWVSGQGKRRIPQGLHLAASVLMSSKMRTFLFLLFPFWFSLPFFISPSSLIRVLNGSLLTVPRHPALAAVARAGCPWKLRQSWLKLATDSTGFRQIETKAHSVQSRKPQETRIENVSLQYQNSLSYSTYACLGFFARFAVPHVITLCQAAV